MNTETLAAPPEIEGFPLESKAPDAKQRWLSVNRENAATFVVQSPESYEQALRRSHAFAMIRKRVIDWFKPSVDDAKKVVEAAKTALATITDQRDDAVEACKSMEAIYDQKAIAWKQAQEWLAEEQTARLNAAAQQAQDDVTLSMAEDAASVGDHETANRLLEQPPQAAPLTVVPTARNVAGVGFVRRLKYRVTNVNAVPPEFWKRVLDDDKIETFANSMKSQVMTPQGVKTVRLPWLEVWGEESTRK